MGADDTRILENLDRICRSGASVRLRCPMVVGANVEDAFLEKILSLAKQYPTVQAIQLMPYHNTGTHKSVTLGRKPQTEFITPDTKDLSAFAKKIKLESKKETLL